MNREILNFIQTGIIHNRMEGKEIKCIRGLRLGDFLSLFMLVVDGLDVIIRKAKK